MKILKHKLLISTALIASFANCGYISHAKNPTKLEDDSQMQVRVPHSSKVGDEERMEVLRVAAAKPSIALKNPLIEVTENGKKASALLTDNQDTLLRMNDLSYNLSKGYLKFSVDEQERLQKEGWVIKGFTGLEGRRNNFGDLAGIVCYHSQKNVITVVYHGTAGNTEGWETNFDGEKIESKNIPKEFRKDLHEEIKATLKNNVANKSDIEELNRLLKSIKPQDFSNQQMLQVKDMAENLAKSGKISTELRDDLVHAVNVKLELLEYLNETGCNIPGEIHKGFAKKYYSSKKEELALLKHFIDNLPEDKKESVQIIHSGHSQAGGIGVIAQADIGANHNGDLFGDKLTNQSSGRYHGYFLSAARAGDKDFAKWMHEKIGKDYIVRQNVDGDPVPIALGDKAVGSFVRSKLPGVGDTLSRMADYEDVGHLLLDGYDDVWNRAQGLYKEAKVDVNELANLEHAILYAANWAGYDESMPGFIAQKKSSGSWNPLAPLWQINNVRHYGMLLKDAASGKEEAQEKMGLLLEQRYGHLHYGHYKEGVGATFDPNIVGRNLNKLLENGNNHEKTKAEKKAKAKAEQEHAIAKRNLEAAEKKHALELRRSEKAQKKLEIVQEIAVEAN